MVVENIAAQLARAVVFLCDQGERHVVAWLLSHLGEFLHEEHQAGSGIERNVAQMMSDVGRMRLPRHRIEPLHTGKRRIEA